MSAPVQRENINPELDQLCINTIRTLSLDAVQKAKPQGAKGHFINRIAISSTMGPGVKVEPQSVFNSAAAQ